MRIELTDQGRTVWFRQSWMNTALRCPDLGRRSAFETLSEATNEYAGMGTALHAGIEAAARGEATTPREVADVAVAAFDALDVTFVDDGGRAEAHKWLNHWATLLRGQEDFERTVRSNDVLIEMPFHVEVAHATSGDGFRTTIGFEGHMDTLHPGLMVGDWKSTSRQFRRWEQQRWNVQGTVYTEAARQMGLLPSDRPSLFRLVVFYRSAKKPVETVDIWRDSGWTKFLINQCWRWVNMYDSDLLSWPLNDQHALCSERWCPAWDTCKGRFMAVNWKEGTE